MLPVRQNIAHVPLQFFDEGMLPYFTIGHHTYRTGCGQTGIGVNKKLDLVIKFLCRQLVYRIYFGVRFFQRKIPRPMVIT